MTTGSSDLTENQVSLLAIGNAALRSRWSLAAWMLVGAAVSVFPALFSPATFTATTSFLPKAGSNSGPSGLASLAGQFGLSIGGGESASQNPDFYLMLIQSPTILVPISRDTISIAEINEVRTVSSLIGISEEDSLRRDEVSVNKLRKIIVPRIASKTGVVTVAVTTERPTLSTALAEKVITAINRFNRDTRRGQSVEERQSIEALLSGANGNLLGAEQRLQQFLQRNAEYVRSPQLRFEHDRLQREVTRYENIATSLAKALDEARIRELRDAPQITVVEQPMAPSLPNPRGRIRRAVGGLFGGAFFGLFFAFLREAMRKRQTGDDKDVAELKMTIEEIKAEIRRFMLRFQ